MKTKQMKLNRLLLLGVTLGAQLTSQTLRAEDTAETVKQLQQRIEQLEQKVRILERKRELDQEVSAETAKTTPLITAGANGFTLRSADTNFVVAVHGVLQVDNRTFFNDGKNQGNDGFLLRRARPILQGTLYRDFDFLFVPEFGGTSGAQIYDAYLNYRYRPELQLRAGKFKVPVGLEQLQSDPNTLFNERSLVTALTPNRDIGFQLWGDIAGGALSYAVGVFNGVGDGRNTSNADFEDHREVAARFFAQPFKHSRTTALQGLGFGIAGSYGNTVSNSMGLASGYLTDGQQTFFTYTNNVVASGDHWRLSPQGYYYYGPFGLLGEYVISDQRVTKGTNAIALQHAAWQVSASWVLTGEDASYSGVTPRHPFDLASGHWGAFQVVGRYAELDIDDDAFPLFSNPDASASEARAWSAGLNWYLNRNLRINASYSHTTFSGGGGKGTSAPAAVTRQPEEVFFTRVQLTF
jgi:phosphate-selective porin OprO/OprP